MQKNIRTKQFFIILIIHLLQIFLASPVCSYKIEDFKYEMEEPIEKYFDDSKNLIGRRVKAYLKVIENPEPQDYLDAIIMEKPSNPKAEKEISLGESAITKLGLNTDKLVLGFLKYLMMDRDEKGRIYHIRSTCALSFGQIKSKTNSLNNGLMAKRQIFKFMRDIIMILATLHNNNLVFAKLRPETFVRFSGINIDRAGISSLFGVLEKDTEEWKTSNGDQNSIYASTFYWTASSTKDKILPIHNYESLGWIGLYLATSSKRELFIESYYKSVAIKMKDNDIWKIKGNIKDMNLEDAMALLINSDINFDKSLLEAFKKYFEKVYKKSILGNKNEWVLPNTLKLLACFEDFEDNKPPNYSACSTPVYVDSPPYSSENLNDYFQSRSTATTTTCSSSSTK